MLQRLVSPVLIVAVLFLGTACARSSGLVKPGDTIGEVVVKATPDALRLQSTVATLLVLRIPSRQAHTRSTARFLGVNSSGLTMGGMPRISRH